MKKILITGATGFIGKNLLDYFLKKNYFIFVTLRKSQKKQNLDLQLLGYIFLTKMLPNCPNSLSLREEMSWK